MHRLLSAGEILVVSWLSISCTTILVYVTFNLYESIALLSI